MAKQGGPSVWRAAKADAFDKSNLAGRAIALLVVVAFLVAIGGGWSAAVAQSIVAALVVMLVDSGVAGLRAEGLQRKLQAKGDTLEFVRLSLDRTLEKHCRALDEHTLRAADQDAEVGRAKMYRAVIEKQQLEKELLILAGTLRGALMEDSRFDLPPEEEPSQ